MNEWNEFWNEYQLLDSTILKSLQTWLEKKYKHRSLNQLLVQLTERCDLIADSIEWPKQQQPDQPQAEIDFLRDVAVGLQTGSGNVEDWSDWLVRTVSKRAIAEYGDPKHPLDAWDEFWILAGVFRSEVRRSLREWLVAEYWTQDSQELISRLLERSDEICRNVKFPNRFQLECGGFECLRIVVKNTNDKVDDWNKWLNRGIRRAAISQYRKRFGHKKKDGEEQSVPRPQLTNLVSLEADVASEKCYSSGFGLHLLIEQEIDDDVRSIENWFDELKLSRSSDPSRVKRECVFLTLFGMVALENSDGPSWSEPLRKVLSKWEVDVQKVNDDLKELRKNFESTGSGILSKKALRLLETQELSKLAEIAGIDAGISSLRSLIKRNFFRFHELYCWRTLVAYPPTGPSFLNNLSDAYRDELLDDLRGSENRDLILQKLCDVYRGCDSASSIAWDDWMKVDPDGRIFETFAAAWDARSDDQTEANTWISLIKGKSNTSDPGRCRLILLCSNALWIAFTPDCWRKWVNGFLAASKTAKGPIPPNDCLIDGPFDDRLQGCTSIGMRWDTLSLRSWWFRTRGKLFDLPGMRKKIEPR